MAVDFSRDVYCLLGLPFDAVSMDGAESRVRRSVQDRRRLFISTPNLNFLTACLDDEAFRASVLASDLSVADGMPIVWMARLLGLPIRERVAGSGLFDVLRRDRARRVSVYFFGGPEGAAAAACAKLGAEQVGMTCAGFESPGYGSVEDMSGDAIIGRINASGADFLLVALGARKGQAWIVRNRNRITVPVVSHLGAVVNFAAGTISRAPGWMQRGGLEWLWRIKEEPGLWRRYWQDGRMLFRLLATRVLPCAWHFRLRPLDSMELAGASVDVKEEDGESLVRLGGAWGRGNLGPLRECFSRLVAADRNVRLDMAGVSAVDSAFLGLLMLLHGHMTARGRRLAIDGLRPGVGRVFELSCAGFLLG